MKRYWRWSIISFIFATLYFITGGEGFIVLQYVALAAVIYYAVRTIQEAKQK